MIFLRMINLNVWLCPIPAQDFAPEIVGLFYPHRIISGLCACMRRHCMPNFSTDIKNERKKCFIGKRGEREEEKMFYGHPSIQQSLSQVYGASFCMELKQKMDWNKILNLRALASPPSNRKKNSSTICLCLCVMNHKSWDRHLTFVLEITST